MARAERSVVIGRPVEEVWAYLGDPGDAPELGVAEYGARGTPEGFVAGQWGGCELGDLAGGPPPAAWETLQPACTSPRSLRPAAGR